MAAARGVMQMGDFVDVTVGIDEGETGQQASLGHRRQQACARHPACFGLLFPG